MSRKQLTVYVDEDILAWLRGSENRFGADQSKKIRTLLRAGLDRLSKDNPDLEADSPRMTIPGYDVNNLTLSAAQLAEELHELQVKHEEQKRRLKLLHERLARAEEKLRIMPE